MIWLEAIPLTSRKRGGLLHDSGPVLLRGSRVDGESVTVGRSRRRRRTNMGLIFSSTLQAEPCVSPMCDSAIRLVSQWDLTVGDLRARNLWFRSSSGGFPRFTGGSRHGEWSFKWQFVLVPSSKPAPPSLPTAHLRMGLSVPWFRLGLLCGSSVLRANPPQSSLCSTGVCTCWGGQGGWHGWLGTTSGGNVVPVWRHLAGWQAGRRGPDASQVGCSQTGAWWESSWPRG